MALDQGTRLLSLQVTGLGDNELLLTSFSGHEEISRPFSFQLDMISDNNGITAEQVVGKKVNFSVMLADESPRYFNGLINRFSAGDEDENGRRNYTAEVVPWLWFLSQTADCRIFQNKTIPQIIEQIFQDLGFSDFETSEIKGEHKEWEYCVQYRETDLNFVSRLLEQEGICYFFKHENGKHVLVLADSKNAYKDCVESEVSFPGGWASRPAVDHITSWEHRYGFHSGKFAQTDFNFKKPSTSLMSQTNTKTSLVNIKNFEIYDYPGEYAEKNVGDSEVKLRIEEAEVQHDIIEGTSLCKTFTPGGKFKIKEHRAKSEEGKKFVITSIQHSATEVLTYETSSVAGIEYTNSFSAIPDAVVFRPPRTTPKPLVSGVQTAIIVGPAGEEIYPDEFGRVKVQFHWDREGKNDENSSCWMRVSQIHAGKGFGAISIPRIGEEVIVDFLEGDPDRPIITGRVYHAENMPPYGLPDSKNISGLKSNSTLGGGGYNEYVMDDSKGNELIREHGQFDKDSTIENDLREHVLNNRSRDVAVDETISIGNNQTYDIGVNQTGTVGADKTLSIGANHTETIGANMTINVGSSLSETVAVAYTETVGAAMVLTVGAAMTQTVGAVYALSVGAAMAQSVGGPLKVSVGGSLSETVGGKHSAKAAGDYSINAPSILLDAGKKITLKTGGASIIMESGGKITIKGTDIKFDASGKAVIKGGGSVKVDGPTIDLN